ncbi:hypothetical protein ACJ41O_006828 [Fusarium nematophilum]
MADGQIFNAFNPAFMSCYFQAKKAVDEEPIKILWTTILGTWFPPVGPQCYKFAVMSPTMVGSDEPFGIVIEVLSVSTSPIGNSTQFLEKQVFIVECKGPGWDTPEGWQATTEQLTHYLENNAGCKKLFGAVAIGTKVEVYEWEYCNGRLYMNQIHAHRLDLGSAEDRCAFEVALELVRTEG